MPAGLQQSERKGKPNMVDYILAGQIGRVMRGHDVVRVQRHHKIYRCQQERLACSAIDFEGSRIVSVKSSTQNQTMTQLTRLCVMNHRPRLIIWPSDVQHCHNYHTRCYVLAVCPATLNAARPSMSLS